MHAVDHECSYIEVAMANLIMQSHFSHMPRHSLY